MPEHADSDAEIAACYDVMAELRPHIAREEFLPLIRRMQADGFRLACIRAEGRVVAVAGYRFSTNLFYGDNLYVDDLVTAEAERSKGYGKELLAWLRALAVEKGCRAFHLDSGVQRKRAHEFYLREGLELSSYHFSVRLPRTLSAPWRRSSSRPARCRIRALAAGVRALARRDPDLAALFRRNGMPPMWARRPGFATLVHIVLEQQVSIVAARTLYQRLRAHLGEMTPGAVAAHGVARLKRFGLTRQKASYCHELALAVQDGRLDLAGVARAEDSTGRETLLAMRGLGPWSVDIYYLMALRRPDVWPSRRPRARGRVRATSSACRTGPATPCSRRSARPGRRGVRSRHGSCGITI